MDYTEKLSIIEMVVACSVIAAVLSAIIIYGLRYDPHDKGEAVISHPVFGTVQRIVSLEEWQATLTEPEWGELLVCGERSKNGVPNAIQVKTYHQIKTGYQGLLLESAAYANEKRGVIGEMLSSKDLKLEWIVLYGDKEAHFTLVFSPLKHQARFSDSFDIYFKNHKPYNFVTETTS